MHDPHKVNVQICKTDECQANRQIYTCGKCSEKQQRRVRGDEYQEKGERRIFGKSFIRLNFERKPEGNEQNKS